MDYNGFAFTRESPWGQCLNHFLQSRRSPVTVQGYTYVLERFFSMPPAKLPDQYSRADIETFIKLRPADTPALQAWGGSRSSFLGAWATGSIVAY